jgi:hypothetical protein
VSFTKKSKLRVQKHKSATPASYRMVVRDEAGKVLVNMMIGKDMRFDLISDKGRLGQKIGKVAFTGLNDMTKGHQKFIVKASLAVATKMQKLFSELVAQQ